MSGNVSDRRIYPQFSGLYGQQNPNHDALVFDGDEEELKSSVALYYMELLDLETKLGNSAEKYDVEYVLDGFKGLLEKIGKRNLRDLFSKLQIVVARKREEYKDKIEKEENEAYENLIGEYFHFSDISVHPELNFELQVQRPGAKTFLPDDLIMGADVPEQEDIILIK